MIKRLGWPPVAFPYHRRSPRNPADPNQHRLLRYIHPQDRCHRQVPLILKFILLLVFSITAIFQPRDPSSAPSALQEAPRTLPSRSSRIFARLRSAERPPLHLKGAVKILRRTSSLDPVDLKDVWEGIWTAPNNEEFRVSIRSLNSNCLDTDGKGGQKQMKQVRAPTCLARA